MILRDFEEAVVLRPYDLNLALATIISQGLYLVVFSGSKRLRPGAEFLHLRIIRAWSFLNNSFRMRTRG